MSTLYIMVPVAIALAVLALLSFIWAVRTGQYDDPQSHAYRMLFDDDPKQQHDSTKESEPPPE